ncbi:MAG: S8 family serine peptidase, partial [Bacteroidota bacterium]
MAVLQYLAQEGIVHRSFSIVNAISTQITEEQAEEILLLQNVANIIPNPWVRQDLGFIERNNANARQAVEWGVQRIGAPALWEMGYLGEGVVVGGQDTGYDFRHPTLISKYRGTIPGDTIHDYNWHDAIRVLNPLHGGGTNPCGLDVTEPCDDNNHGTHTMGTMVGDDGNGNQIGIAPEAKWIACRNMERGYGSPASYIECFEWFLAPTKVDGTEPDPSKAPHVIANSWSCPEMEGCVPENFSLMETAINNLRAAGVMVVTSAGNSGSQGCGSVSTPPSIFGAAYAVGATNDQDTIAGFSSRGPVTIDGSNRLQPQVVAPGVNVRSSVRNGAYANFSGTSMAGPHVAGAVALLISAYPNLAGNVEGLERIFRESALPLFSSQNCGDFPGDARPNAVYGYGRIDLIAAFNLAQTLVNAEEEVLGENIAVAPNPTQDIFQIYTPTNSTFSEGSLVDINGKIVVQLQLGSNGISIVDIHHI